MKLQFEKEGNSTFAIVEDVEYKGKMIEELLFCEVYELSSVFWVAWEDAYNQQEPFNSYEAAVAYVEQNYKSHTPHINGKSYEIKED